VAFSGTFVGFLCEKRRVSDRETYGSAKENIGFRAEKRKNIFYVFTKTD